VVYHAVRTEKRKAFLEIMLSWINGVATICLVRGTVLIPIEGNCLFGGQQISVDLYSEFCGKSNEVTLVPCHDDIIIVEKWCGARLVLYIERKGTKRVKNKICVEIVVSG
jgi:hypothetical protein